MILRLSTSAVIRLNSTIRLTCSTENAAVFHTARQNRSRLQVDGSKWLPQSSSVARLSKPTKGRSFGYSSTPPVNA
jgi:hypothetical protein